MNTAGERLKEERLRLGLDMDGLASRGGVKKLAQRNYEDNKRRPDVGYLEGIAKAGVDVNYVITGRRSDDHHRKKANPVETLQLVAEVLCELGLSNMQMDKINILVEYANEYSPTKRQLSEYIKSMYAFAGIQLPPVHSGEKT